MRQFSPIRGAQPGDATPRRYQEAREDLTTDYFWIFPNWMLNCYPDNVSLNIVLPVEPERSLAIFEWYLPEKDHSTPAAKASVEFSDQIQIEDVGICEIVQKNLRSRSYTRGRFSVKQEKGVHAFHRMYAETMRPNTSQTHHKSCHSERLVSGARNLLFFAAGKQQVPPLRRRIRSGSGRNDKGWVAQAIGKAMWKIRHSVCTQMYGKSALARAHELLCPERTIQARPAMPFAGPETALRATISAATTLRSSSKNKRVCAPLCALYVFSITSTQRQQLPRRLNDLRGTHFVF